MHFKMLSAICFNLDQSKILSSGNGLKSQRKKSLEDILGKGENAGNKHFLFSQNVFYLSKNRFQIFSQIYFFVCQCFQYG